MLTANTCKDLMGRARKGQRKLKGTATYLREWTDGNGQLRGYVVHYHSTPILFVGLDGTFTLNTSGHETVTTKRKLNEHSPVSVHQRDYVWYWTTPGMAQWCQAYQDGDTFDQSGRYLGRRKLDSWNGQPTGQWAALATDKPVDALAVQTDVALTANAATPVTLVDGSVIALHLLATP